jgi:hypothetical protein
VVVVPPEDPSRLADGLELLLTDPRRAGGGVSSGRRWPAERLSAQRMARQAWEAFRASLGPPPRPAPG